MAEYRNPQSEPGMDKNLLLIMLVIAAVIFGSQFFLKKYAPPPKPEIQQSHPSQPAAAAQPGANVPAAAAAPPAATVSKARKPAAAPVPAKQATAESQIVIESDLYKITFTNRGAQAKSWILKKYKDDQGHPLDLVNSAAAAKYGYPLSLWTYDQAQREKLNSALYVPSSTAPALNAPADLSFEYSESGLTVRKTLHFDRTYVVTVETSVIENGSPVSAFPAWPSGFGDQANAAAYASAQFEYQNNGDVQRIPVKKVSGGNTLHGTYDWLGVSSTYFAAVYIPDSPDNLNVVTLNNSLELPSSSGKPEDTKAVEVIGLAVGQPGTYKGRIFVGPKALDVLDSVKVPTIIGAEKDLRDLLNFGWFGPIARPLFAWKYIGLRWFDSYIHNWGWAIVIQTFIINILMFPLVVYQMKSALKMQKVQPQMKAIQEKYKKYSMRDPRKQEMQKEIAALYREHGVNPVGGCLPLLLQLPFLYAYYRMLGTAIDLRQAHWLWIHDLSGSDIILPVIMAVSMFLSQRMTPQPGIDPAQQKMMNWMMPVMMGVLFFRFPSGLNLYYAESNFIRMGQQWIMNQTKLGREIKEIAAKRARKKNSS
ncbi:MAG TPA: membrane protein insertase YidC [Terriglobales bacterium]